MKFTPIIEFLFRWQPFEDIEAEGGISVKNLELGILNIKFYGYSTPIMYFMVVFLLEIGKIQESSLKCFVHPLFSSLGFRYFGLF